MPEGKSPLGKPRADPVSLASGKPHLVRLSLFGFGLSELGFVAMFQSNYYISLFVPFFNVAMSLVLSLVKSYLPNINIV